MDTTVRNAHPTLEAGVGSKTTAGGGDQHVNLHRRKSANNLLLFWCEDFISIYGRRYIILICEQHNLHVSGVTVIITVSRR